MVSYASFLPNSCTIDDELLKSIDPEQTSHKLVIEGSNGADTTIELLSCEIEVLAYMPRVEVHQPIGSFAIPPGHSVDYARPDGMESTGRWNITKSGVWFVLLDDPLSTP